MGYVHAFVRVVHRGCRKNGGQKITNNEDTKLFVSVAKRKEMLSVTTQVVLKNTN